MVPLLLHVELLQALLNGNAVIPLPAAICNFDPVAHFVQSFLKVIEVRRWWYGGKASQLHSYVISTITIYGVTATLTYHGYPSPAIRSPPPRPPALQSLAHPHHHPYL